MVHTADKSTLLKNGTHKTSPPGLINTLLEEKRLQDASNELIDSIDVKLERSGVQLEAMTILCVKSSLNSF